VGKANHSEWRQGGHREPEAVPRPGVDRTCEGIAFGQRPWGSAPVRPGVTTGGKVALLGQGLWTPGEKGERQRAGHR
jgi:hypothetical protein